MRIPYAPDEPPPDSSPEISQIYQRIRDRRHPRPLIPLDLALLHNPQIADGYNSFIGAIRNKSSLPLGLAELAICHVAVLNGAVYEWKSHAPLALQAGVTRSSLESVLKKGGEESVSALLSSVSSISPSSGDEESEGKGLTDDEKLICEFTFQSTRQIRVDDGVMDRLKTRFSTQQVMELSITVAAYNMVSRFLVGLDVTESNDKEMEMPPEK